MKLQNGIIVTVEMCEAAIDACEAAGDLDWFSRDPCAEEARAATEVIAAAGYEFDTFRRALFAAGKCLELVQAGGD